MDREPKPRDSGFYEEIDAATADGGHKRPVQRFSIPDGTGVRVLDEHPLDRLKQRGTIDRRQHDAGILYYGQWLRCRAGGYTAINPDNINAGEIPRKAEFTPDTQLDADRDIREADKAIGKVNAAMIRYICAEARTIADWVTRMNRTGTKTNPHRETGRLQAALECLAAHYRL